MKSTSEIALLCFLLPVLARGQQSTPGSLDRGGDPAALHLPPASHLSEQFIWTANDAAALNPELQSRVRGQNDKTPPHYFRAHFNVAAVPLNATLYLAGPRSATIFINGQQVAHFTDDGAPSKGFNVELAEVSTALHAGENVLAIEEVRGHSSLHTGASPTINQVTYGEVLALKIVPGSIAIDAPPLLVTDSSWRSILTPMAGWQVSTFDDALWPRVSSLGVIGSKSDFLQWNADAGLYALPGYSGIGAAMRTLTLPAVAMRDLSSASRFSQHPTPAIALTVSPGAPASITLDFGRELSGRIHLVSASDTAVTVDTSYGESAEEAAGHPYLGVRKVTVPAHGEAFGPKSAFRFVRLTFPVDASSWAQLDAQAIIYPVEYRGSFESSDPVLNRIWETGAFTAHLCMGEGIWDAPKRDRGRWMGDLDVTGRVISSVFLDRPLMEETMQQVIGDSPVHRDVNTIAGYSALWITGQADFYRHLGDFEYLERMHGRLLELLAVMDAELDSTGLFTNPGKHKVFVDWSNDFNADTPEARAATHFEFYLAYQQAAYLLTELEDQAHAATYFQRAETLRLAAQSALLNPALQTFGTRWQTNAMAVVSGAATLAEQSAIWRNVLARVPDPSSTDVVTPYYGFYVLSAMADLNHRPEALDWMRRYWGGMLAEGATSFWEAYDPHWPKSDYHASLEADNKRGYYVSLAHGWASGPTAWLMSEVLGIQPTAAGFTHVAIRPDLAGLAWARGAEPTPRGLIRVDAQPGKVTVVIPPGTIATVSLPFPSALQDGKPARTQPAEADSRVTLTLDHPGTYIFTSAERKPS